MKKIFLPIMLCALMVLSSVLLACEPIGEHKHEFIEVPQVEATCSEAGIRAHRECRICRYWFDEEGNLIDEREFIIPATGVHKFVEVPKVEATCGEAGVDAHRECEQCDKWFDADGNQIDKSSCTIPATNNHHFENGTCTVCGAEHEHKFVDVQKKDATCGEAGVKAHKECEECDKWFNEQGEVIDKSSCEIPATNNHHFENGTCTVCGTEDPTWEGPEEPEITLPEGLVGKYFDENDKENYIEVSKDKSVKTHIDNEDTTFTVTKVEDNKVTLSSNDVIEFNAEAGSITYNEVTYYDDEHYPAEPELKVPEQFNGTFVAQQKTYIFDGSVNVKIRNIDGTMEDWTITEVTPDKDGVSVTLNCADKTPITLRVLTTDPNLLFSNGTGHAYKGTAADNIPDEIVGKYVNGSMSIEVREDGYLIYRPIASMSWQYLIIEYNDETGEFTIASNSKMTCTFDKAASTITFAQNIYTKEKADPSFPDLAGIKGEFYALDKTYIFDGDNVTVVNVADNAETKYTINSSENGSMVLKPVGEGADVNLYYKKEDGTLHKDSATADNLAVRKPQIATGIPENLYGEYLQDKSSSSYRKVIIEEGGRLVCITMRSSNDQVQRVQQFFITSYTVDDGKFVAGLLTTTNNCQFDGNNTITFNTLTLVRINAGEKEPADPSFPDLAGIKGEFYALDKTYIFDGDNVTVVNVADNAETKYTINSSENGSMVLKAVGEGADVNLYYKAEDDTLHTNSTTAANLAVRKPKIATNIPEKLYGTYVYKMNSVVTYTYVIEKVGRFVQRIEMSTMPQANQYRQYFITSYSGTGDFVASLIQSVNGKFDGYNKIAIGSFTAVNESAEAAPVVTLPEGMAGKYYDEKNQENYFEISDDGVTAHIDGEDKAYKLIKAEGNNVTLNNEQVLTYNAEEHSITWDGNKYIDWDHYEFKLPFDLPENFFGRYTNSNRSIEIRKDGTVTFTYPNGGPNGEWVIVGWDEGTLTLTMTQVTGGSFTNESFYWSQEADGTMKLSYSGSVYTKAAA